VARAARFVVAASTHSVFLLAAMPDRAHSENLVKTASSNTDADEEEW